MRTIAFARAPQPLEETASGCSRPYGRCDIDKSRGLPRCTKQIRKGVTHVIGRFSNPASGERARGCLGGTMRSGIATEHATDLKTLVEKLITDLASGKPTTRDAQFVSMELGHVRPLTAQLAFVDSTALNYDDPFEPTAEMIECLAHKATLLDEEGEVRNKE